eukprot:CAMPEP_0170169456 /NCGR_PEP_ID=MMETSP0040_2-20121228/2375_1 /TAXON_ID=641309 /ORGANISM="Lotharella oceanica, Strain CCMP622" /LENGTH=184 /DNA_ID=CAMNT_0010408219 /DNA_START=113 /DNA_END=667 /DNA_ORIENTATION=-
MASTDFCTASTIYAVHADFLPFVKLNCCFFLDSSSSSVSSSSQEMFSPAVVDFSLGPVSTIHTGNLDSALDTGNLDSALDWAEFVDPGLNVLFGVSHAAQAKLSALFISVHAEHFHLLSLFPTKERRHLGEQNLAAIVSSPHTVHFVNFSAPLFLGVKATEPPTEDDEDSSLATNSFVPTLEAL